MPESQDKVCVICGASCAGQPRIKNEKGQYAHQACAKRQSAKPAPKPMELGLDEDDLSGLLDDLPDVGGPALGAGGMKAGCPGCGAAVTADTVICTACGFNQKTGKGLKTKVAAAPKPGGSGLGAVAGAAGGVAAAGTAFLVGSLLGGAIAAGVGALVWGGIAIVTGYEVGFVAIGVGALCGIGTALGSRGQTGMMTGVIAVVFAVLGICVGKFAAVSFYVDKELDGSSLIEHISNGNSDNFMLQIRIDQLVQQRLDGSSLTAEQRSDYIDLLDAGEFPDDYPDELVQLARDEWAALPEHERARLLAEQESLMRDLVQAGGFLSTFGFFDIIFFFIAIGAAYKLGSDSD